MIIGITGSIAAGKETLTDFLRKKGFVYLETSKILAEELVRRGLEPSRWNMQNLGDELRGKDGPGALMKMLLEKTESGKDYIFDSLRNAGEAEYLRNNVKNFILISVDAPQKIRFKRILERGKPSDPKTWEEFLKIDNRDFFDETNPMGQQTGKCMEIADFKIINDADLEKSKKEIKEVWKRIEEGDIRSVKKTALLCIREKKILIVHKKTIDMYISPGGKNNEGEDDHECLKREIQEELNCGVRNLNYFKTFEGKAPEGFYLELRCYFGELDGDIKLNPMDNIDGYLWIDRDYDKNLKLASMLEHEIIPYLIGTGLM